ncbi:photosystem II assembly family protein [Synechococcus sp. A15-60]|uniref:photosystem II assembly family protein n=1 Tax=unclassified Synechococcus TaxID=2626047 RepID=UPI00351B1461
MLWLALFASGGLGLFVMTFRLSAGDQVVISDLTIQVGAVVLFGFLLWFDRSRDS